jgi:tripartite-type tricarboxylate transporter receptor subunit TctC
MRRRELNRRALVAALAASPLGVPSRSAAVAWPDGPLRITLAYPPGGISDSVLRDLAARLAPRLGVAVQVDHLPGAGGALALRALARARPDGRSLCFCAISPLTVQPHLSASHADLPGLVAPLLAVMATPVLVLGTPALVQADFAAMVGAARRPEASLRWATSGVATTGHLVLEQVRRLSGGHFVHVPYKGGGQQIHEALAGQFELLSSNVAGTQVELVRQGRLRALAVGAPAPLAVLPGVPTLEQLGYADANLGSVFGLFAPASTAPSLLDRLHAGIAPLVQEASFRERLLAQGNLPLGGTREQFAQDVARDAQRHGPLIRQAIHHFR